MFTGVWAIAGAAAATALIVLSGCGPDASNIENLGGAFSNNGSASLQFRGAVNRASSYGASVSKTHVTCALSKRDGDFQIGISEQGDSYRDNYGARDGIFFTLFERTVPAGELPFGGDDFSSAVAQVGEFTGRQRLFRADPREPCRVDIARAGDHLQGGFDCQRMVNDSGDRIGVSGRFDCVVFGY